MKANLISVAAGMVLCVGAVEGGEIYSFSPMAGAKQPIPSADATHSDFTKIGVGARVFDTEASIYHVNLSGTTTP
jgi:hypothetical protein